MTEKTEKPQTVTIYTDGACKGNPGIGGWGALLAYGKHEKTICGGEHNTTNNRMELMAAIKALALLKRPCKIELWTDSTYVKKGISEWIFAWKKNHWRTAAKKPVVNKDLWHPGNEIADQLANQGIEKIRQH